MPILESETKVIGETLIENLLHDSSNVIKTSYNFTTHQLFVTFKKGIVYNYNDVPHNVYRQLKEADSVGKFINAEIKPKYTVSKKGEAKPEILNELVNKISTYKSNV